jgi:hypothetical protein
VNFRCCHALRQHAHREHRHVAAVALEVVDQRGERRVDRLHAHAQVAAELGRQVDVDARPSCCVRGLRQVMP